MNYRIKAKFNGEKTSYSVSSEGLTRKLIYALGYETLEQAEGDAKELRAINPGVTFTPVKWNS